MDWFFIGLAHGRRQFFESVHVEVMGRKTLNNTQRAAHEKAFYPDMRNYEFATTKASGIRDGVESIFTPRLPGSGTPPSSQSYPETEMELVRCRKYDGGLVQLSNRVTRQAARCARIESRYRPPNTAPESESTHS